MDILKINTCPLCGGKHLGHAITCTDHYASGEQFNLVRCDDCGFIFTQGAPVEAEIGRYYETPDYISHTDIRKGLMNRVYHEVRKYMLSRKAKLIKRTSGLSKGTLLDIGTGTGYFSNAEDDEERGWQELLEHRVNTKDTVIGIAASGTTPYVIGALRKAREQGILTASISSNPDSPMAMEADVSIEMIVGPEFVTGSSRMKSGTGQKMILNMISTSVMIRLGRVKGNRMVNMQLTNQKLIDRGTRMVAEELNLPYNQSRHLLLMYGLLFSKSRRESVLLLEMPHHIIF